jgi:hypothetical protein
MNDRYKEVEAPQPIRTTEPELGHDLLTHQPPSPAPTLVTSLLRPQQQRDIIWRWHLRRRLRQ